MDTLSETMDWRQITGVNTANLKEIYAQVPRLPRWMPELYVVETLGDLMRRTILTGHHYKQLDRTIRSLMNKDEVLSVFTTLHQDVTHQEASVTWLKLPMLKSQDKRQKNSSTLETRTISRKEAGVWLRRAFDLFHFMRSLLLIVKCSRPSRDVLIIKDLLQLKLQKKIYTKEATVV